MKTKTLAYYLGKASKSAQGVLRRLRNQRKVGYALLAGKTAKEVAEEMGYTEGSGWQMLYRYGWTGDGRKNIKSDVLELEREILKWEEYAEVLIEQLNKMK